MINRLEFESLLHDLKRLGKAIVLIADEEDIEKRKLIGGLLKDELDRLYEDITEMKNGDTE